MTLAYQSVRLPYLIRCLLKPPLRHINLPIALVNVLVHVAHVVVVEGPPFLLFRIRRIVFSLKLLAVYLRTWADILFSVCEPLKSFVNQQSQMISIQHGYLQVVRASANEIRTADFRVGDWWDLT